MKARDLAALAALGVAGYAAYNKFGKKKDAPASGTRAGAELGKSGSANDGDTGESEARMNMRDMNEGSGRRDAGGNTEDVDRRAGVPERMGKDAAGSRFTDRDVVSEKFTPRDKEGLIKKKDVSARPSAAGANSKTPAAALKASAANDESDAAAKSLSSTGGPSRARTKTIAAESSDSGSLSSQGGPSRFVRTTPAASAPVSSSTAAPARYNRAADSNAASNAMAASDTSGSLSSQGGPSRYKPSAVAPSAPASAAATARQRAIDAKNYDSDLMKGRRQAVVDTVKNIPANVANAFKPLTKQEIIDQRNYDSQINRDRREAAFGSVKNLFGFKKGGAVKKMASGGMTSSKMSSKPSSASSRGDGIAQRGKTRGQMR